MFIVLMWLTQLTTHTHGEVRARTDKHNCQVNNDALLSDCIIHPVLELVLKLSH